MKIQENKLDRSSAKQLAASADLELKFMKETDDLSKEIVAAARILIVDDELPIRNILQQLLEARYECVAVASAEEALARLHTESFNLVLSDINMTGISGLELVPRVLDLAPETIVILISGERNIESVVEAMRVGAFDYVTKPFALDLVETVIERAVEHQALRLTKKRYEDHLEELVTVRTKELREQITERQQAEEKVNRMAYYDSLTGLPNPTLFKDRLTHELDLSENTRQKSAVIYLALDRFKNINDTLGHGIGDQLIHGVARRLTKSIPPIDTVAYFGGAEFALLLPKISGAEDVAKVAESITNAMMLPFDCDGHELYVTASLGISLSPDDGHDCQTLLQNAGTALYRAGQRGGNTSQFFTNDMHETAVKRLAIENNLRGAFERDEFILHYQPKINIESGEIFGMEALVRWQHPVLGIVSPADFIPVAEETGLIIPLGEWVLRAACRQNVLWQRAGLPALSVSVNLSLRQFQQADLVEEINRILTESGLDPKYLELELTESVIMKDATQAIETLNLLKQIGIDISLDDFGTGYSCLSYLKTIPVDTLKIDRAFVQNVTTDLKDVAIVKTIITLADNLKLKTIVEGLETQAQLDVLSDLGCSNFQGYFYSKPLPADLFEQLLMKTHAVLVHS